MHRVGEQREAPGDEASDDLDDRVRGSQDQGDGEGAPARRARMVVIVSHAGFYREERGRRRRVDRRWRQVRENCRREKEAKATAASPMRLGPASGSSPASSRGRTTK